MGLPEGKLFSFCQQLVGVYRNWFSLGVGAEELVVGLAGTTSVGSGGTLWVGPC